MCQRATPLCKLTQYEKVGYFVKKESIFRIHYKNIQQKINMAEVTRCDFFPHVSADNSAEEANHIESSGAVPMRSAAIFSPHFSAQSGQLVHAKSQ